MMKCLMMMLTIILTSSCNPSSNVEKEDGEYNMVCERVSNKANTVRCENHEAVCYKAGMSYKAGISCYFKQTLIIKDSLNALNTTNNITD